MSQLHLLRRSFLASIGLAGGLALGWETEVEAQPKADPKPPPQPSPGEGFRGSAFVHVAPDGIVTIVCQRSEMGQGIRSSIPVLIADELGADMAKVKIVQGDGDKMYGDQNTDGSRSIRGQVDFLRKAAAGARMMLVAAAAKQWKVDPETCEARDNMVVHAKSKRTIGFGDLANDAAKIKVPLDSEIKLRPIAELRRIGKDLPLLDGPAMVTGKAMYGADIRLPGMLTAVIARPPVPGGKLVSEDHTQALKIPGVKQVVTLPAPTLPFKFQPLGGVAVVADNTWAALRGAAALETKWDPGPNGSYDSAAYKAMLLDSIAKPGKVQRQVGDVAAALATAKTKVEATYYVPHLCHVPMEPLVAVASVQGGKCEVWAPTQNPQSARTEVAKALGLNEKDVTVHVTLLGGGFGRKSKADFVVEAALVSKAVGAPVRVQWPREEDVRHDYFHTVSAQRITAGLDPNGKVTAWQHRIAFPPIASIFTGASRAEAGDLQQGVTDLPLAVPNVRAETAEAAAHTRIGWLRSVNNIFHAFATQSFIDELATTRGIDTKAMQLELLGPARTVTLAELGIDKLQNYGQSLTEHPIDTTRHRAVLEHVCKMADWDRRKESGRSLGLAVHRSFLSYVAVVVSVKKSGEKIHADEAWIVADAGLIVNRERVRSQLEGAVVFGLGQALYGEATMKNGVTEQTNFRDYRLIRMAEAPRKVHVDVIQSSGPSGGIGEPGVPPVAPALANAIFALTGKRIRDLPIVRSLPV